MNIDRYIKSFLNKEYIKGRGKQTEYYILTSKYGEHNYKLTLLRNHLIIMERYYEGLTMAKYGAFEWLLNHDSSIFEMDKVTMVHYKEDRPNGDPWVKGTNIELHKNLKSFFNNSKDKLNLFTQIDVAITQENRKEKNEESGMIIPTLEPVTRSREYNLYDDSIRDRVVYESLFNSKTRRWLDEHVIGLNPDASRGYQAMGILHFIGLKDKHKGIFKDLSIDEAIQLIEQQDSDFSLVIQSLQRIKQQDNFDRNLEEGYSEEEYIELDSIVTTASEQIEITETEKEQVIKSRIGQSTFKKALLSFEKKCKLCGVTDERFLVASHIKPWSQSNN